MNNLIVSRKKLASKNAQIQAAYALNLCTVSVSQIVDYDDIAVLEQEYEAILNNLNLENIPKDEALLDILKRLLETITFFRIQEGDKELIEKEYARNMKNAIWSSVPDLGLLVTGGLNPAALAISIASQVGIGYMNYRKNRAQYQAGREKQRWQLQRTAMEQLQLLQQQLFETSWRLADKYKFPDKYRLTERQIKQYDAILMDPDELRKYERLLSVQDSFEAYPPFWYYLGNTACALARSDLYGMDAREREAKFEEAKRYFQRYCDTNKYDLLREDTIAAACYLEYADMLDARSDKERILELLCRAREAAGSTLDVLQLCAMGYLKLGEAALAQPLLRQLVNEEYNATTNAQLLSVIYVDRYIRQQDQTARADYRLLSYRLKPEYLFPMPTNVQNGDRSLLEGDFIQSQRNILLQKYKLVTKKFAEKYSAEINGIIPLPANGGEPIPGSVYSGTSASRKQRIDMVALTMADPGKAREYCVRISEIPYRYELLMILNRMFSSFSLLERLQDEEVKENLVETVKKAINARKEDLDKAAEHIQKFTAEGYGFIQERVTLGKVTGNLFQIVEETLEQAALGKKEMEDFAIAEAGLSRFCQREGFDDPELLYAHRDDAVLQEDGDILFSPDLLGKEAVQESIRAKILAKMREAIRVNIVKIVGDAANIEFFMSDDYRASRYFSRNRSLDSSLQGKTLAVLDDKTWADADLLFTGEGLIPVVWDKPKTLTEYSEVDWNSWKKALNVGKVSYGNTRINMDALRELIEQLAGIKSSDPTQREKQRAEAQKLIITFPIG